MSNTQAPRWPAVLLALVGLGLSGYLEYLHVRSYLAPLASSVCTIDATYDCNAVAMSRFAVVAGIPLPIWGIASFLALLTAAGRRSRLLLPLALVGTLGSIGLLLEELLHIGSICLFCEGVHLTWLLSLVYALVYRTRLEPVHRHQLFELIGLPVGMLVAFWLFAPRYWELTAWVDEIPYAHGVTPEGHPWVGAENPTVVVEEFTDYGCPHCAIATAKMRRRLADAPDSIRLVRRQQPRRTCPRGTKACAHVRAALCAAEQGEFWRMDSWLFLEAGGKLEVDYTEAAEALGLDAEALLACLEDPRTWERADREARAARKAGVTSTPAYRVDGEKLGQRALFEVLDERL